MSDERLSDHNVIRLADVIDDLWSNIGVAEIAQLQPETIELCRALHQIRYHPRLDPRFIAGVDHR